MTEVADPLGALVDDDTDDTDDDGAPVDDAGRGRVVLEADQIRDLLPHRWPFLFVDRATILEPGRSATGIKNVSLNEPYFPGHFPAMSVLPGVLIVESLAQLAGLVIASGPSVPGGERTPAAIGYLAGIKQFRFRRLVRPGDQLRLQVVATSSSSRLREFRAEARVGGQLASTGVVSIAF